MDFEEQTYKIWAEEGGYEFKIEQLNNGKWKFSILRSGEEIAVVEIADYRAKRIARILVGQDIQAELTAAREMLTYAHNCFVRILELDDRILAHEVAGDALEKLNPEEGSGNGS